MKRRILALLLSALLLFTLLPLSVLAAAAPQSVGTTAIASDYFYRQLNTRAQRIYDLLLQQLPDLSSTSGTKTIDLVQAGIATETDVQQYLKGNRDLFNDFTAAKDALDLDHSELWYLDSSYLSFRVTSDDRGTYQVLLGTGRANNYLLAGKAPLREGTSVSEMDAQVQAAIQKIVSQAKADLAAADPTGTYSAADRAASLVRSVHDQVTRAISYRFENECTAGSEKFIRTLYALVTHEGVCEAYARAVQVCLTQLGVPCILVHGIQASGTPEDHMWNAVRIDEADGSQHWYVVDATWDDPLTADWYGRRELVDVALSNGEDGKENGTYLMVGQDVVGADWRPSGFVSSGNFEFRYPTIEASSYNGDTVSKANGLTVKYSAGAASMEDGLPAGAFTVSFQGMNATEAAEKGFYFLLKMYDYHADGTAHVMDEWYYAAATLLLSSNNKYFYDRPDGLQVYTGTCEYVEVAVTTCKPEGYDRWSNDPATSYLSQHWQAGYYQGTDAEIIAQSGMLYNTNASYEAPPYVLTQTPAPNHQATAGVDYQFDVTFDDELYHPNSSTISAASALPHPLSAATGQTDNAVSAARQQVRVRYNTVQQDLHTGGDMEAVITGELPFDTDRDGYVDAGGYANLQWKYVYTRDTCPNTGYHLTHPGLPCDVSQGCRVNGVSFQFRGSDMWMDDITEYRFSLEGLVGSRSGKYANSFGVVCMIPGLCPACYRSQGIDWNLWGKPTLLDAPDNLNLADISVNGIQDVSNLEELQKQMKVDSLDGRLMLVVEDNSKGNGSRTEYEKVSDALEENMGIPEDSITSSSVYEINFNRICPMVNLKPGQSLRVQVGYPHGVTYESLGKDVVLKAYHFTRCDAAHPCGNENKAGHAYGQDIVGVQEIQMIPNPYGIVILCDSFSPFEIVAVDMAAANRLRLTDTSSQKTVIVVSDANGTVSYEGREAVGASGNIPFRNQDMTFTLQPKAGYSVDTVSFGGKALTVVGNTFTLPADLVTQSDVLSVTFIPAETKLQENVMGFSTVVPEACTHPVLETVWEGIAPSCTEPGYSAELRCAHCGQTVQTRTEVPAEGHQPQVLSVAKEATCTEPGTAGTAVCSVCRKVLSEGGTIPALGHDMEPVDSKPATCQGKEYTYACTRPGCHETETRINPNEAIPHAFDSTGFCTMCGISNTASTCPHIHQSRIPGREASCTEAGLTEGRTCLDCGTVLQEQVPIPPGNHVINSKDIRWEWSSDYSRAAAIVTCAKGCGYTDSIAATVSRWENDATCSSEGTIEFTARITISGQEYRDVQKITSPKLPHTDIILSTEAATCTAGYKTTYQCTVCGTIHTEETGDPLGHSFDQNGVCTRCGFLDRTQSSVSHTYPDGSVSVTRPMLDGSTVETITQPTGTVCAVTRTADGVIASMNITVPASAATEDIVHTIPVPLPLDQRTAIQVSVQGDEPAALELLPETPGGGVVAVRVLADGTEKIVRDCGRTENSILVSVQGTATLKLKDNTKVFTDVQPVHHWAIQGVEFTSSREIFNGTGEGLFSPDATMNRGMLVTALYNLAYNPAVSAANQFPDVPADAFYADAVTWAQANGVVAGKEDGTFAPGDSITREQMVTILYHYAVLLGLDTTGSASLASFSDAGAVSDWAKPAMEWAVSAGLISGRNGTELAPGESANRAEVASIFMNFCSDILF